MNKILPYALVGILTPALAFGQDKGPNLVDNGSFETDFTGGNHLGPIGSCSGVVQRERRHC